MRTKLKQYVSFIILVIFVANITGALLLWHITLEGGFEHHDCDHCPICRNTFINSSKIINTPPATTFSIDIIEHKIEYLYDAPLTSLTTPNLIPRAPPV